MKGKKSVSSVITDAPPKAWTSLSRFQVSYRQRPEDNSVAQVFRNGRQQVPVSIFIEARNDNNEVVPLPAEDLNAITLVNYNTGAALPVTMSISNVYNSDYDYFPENFTAPQSYTEVDRPEADSGLSAPSRNSQPLLMAKSPSVEMTTFAGADGVVIQAQELKLWVTTTNPDTIRIAASLVHGTYMFHTHTPSAAPGGSIDEGNFNSSMRIEPVPPRAFKSASFTMDNYLDHSSPHIQMAVISLWITDQNYRIRKAVNYHTVLKSGWFHCIQKYTNNYFFYAPASDWPGQEIIHHLTGFPPGNDKHFLVNQRLLSEGVANLYILIELNALLPYDNPQLGRMGYIDNMGNESILYLRETAGGTSFVLTDS